MQCDKNKPEDQKKNEINQTKAKATVGARSKKKKKRSFSEEGENKSTAAFSFRLWCVIQPKPGGTSDGLTVDPAPLSSFH